MTLPGVAVVVFVCITSNKLWLGFNSPVLVTVTLIAPPEPIPGATDTSVGE